jgi:putative aminopeptidase FrvX
MDKRLELIKRLSEAYGPSGFEKPVNKVIKNYLEDRFRIEEDAMANMIIYSKSYNPDFKTIMIDGHSDEVGFMVQSIDANGLIKFLPLGGWFSQNVGAHKVKVQTKNGEFISGIVTSKPPHFMTTDEKKKIQEISDMRIDIGTTSYEETTSIYGIEPGACIVPDVSFEYINETEMMIGKAFDNRLGCALVLETMEALEGIDLKINVVGAISTQEEVGTRGVQITARKIKPDFGIVFEGTPADDPYRNAYESQGALRKGPQIRHRDNSMVANPDFIRFSKEVAKSMSINYQSAVRAGGGTDGGNLHLNHEGVPTLVLGVPVRYAHTHYGISAYGDYEKTLNWAVEIIKGMNQKIKTEGRFVL